MIPIVLHLNQDFWPWKHVFLSNSCRDLQSTARRPHALSFCSPNYSDWESRWEHGQLKASIVHQRSGGMTADTPSTAWPPLSAGMCCVDRPWWVIPAQGIYVSMLRTRKRQLWDKVASHKSLVCLFAWVSEPALNKPLKSEWLRSRRNGRNPEITANLPAARTSPFSFK